VITFQNFWDRAAKIRRSFLRCEVLIVEVNPASNPDIEGTMSENEPKRIVGVGRLGKDALVVEYSNNLTALYTLDQLTAIEPREVLVDEDVEEDEEPFPSDRDLIG
jgi:hypothetical protein